MFRVPPLAAVMAAVASLAVAGSAAAATIPTQVMPLVVDIAIDDLLLNDGVLLDGTRADDQSTFNSEFAITGSGQGSDIGTGFIALSEIPVNEGFFEIVYDSQETGGGPSVNIETILIAIDNILVWEYDFGQYGHIALLGDTDSPLGNGADIALRIPLSLVITNGMFSGASILTLNWTQSLSDNGADEWVTVGDGFFQTGEQIYDTNVISGIPVPPALPLLASALAALALLRRRKTR